MAHPGERVEFENDRVRVLRVKTGAQSQDPLMSRRDRLIVYLRDGHIVRAEGGTREEIQHRAGDVVWRAGSQHQVQNLKDMEHEVLIVELK